LQIANDKEAGDVTGNLKRKTVMNPNQVLIGTSGYSYPGPPPKGWYSAFYPDKKAKGFDELNYYSQIFNTCEINNTFYRPPSPAVAQGWVMKTPDDFTFVIKLWQKFTHPIKISRNKSDERWELPDQADFDQFRTGILPLAEAGKLGALLLQYPAGFHYSPENVEKIQSALRRFYDYPKVVELRHKSWSERIDQTRALLAENRASGVLIDEPKFATSIHQDFTPIGEIFYFRAHGRNAKAWWNPKEPWERYDYFYSRDEIKKLGERIKTATAVSGLKKAFVFFNNHANANAPTNAIMLSQELGVRLKSMPPESMLGKFPQLVRGVESDEP
jgi:uncharacterized protein YecE (DUF72 family)